MYVTLLLIAPAICEWVEISQQHYRKPVKTYHFQTLDKVTEPYAAETYENFQHHKNPSHTHNSPAIEILTQGYEEDITSEIPQIRYRKPIRTKYFPADGVTEVYVEDTVSDVSFHDTRKPVRTYHFTTDKVTESYKHTTSDSAHPFRKPTRTHNFPVTNKTELHTEDPNKRNKIYFNQSITGTNFWNKGNVNKVPKHGNVQRVQLDTNVVKAPSLRTNPTKNSHNMEKFKDGYNNTNSDSGVTAVKQSISDTIISHPEDNDSTNMFTDIKKTNSGPKNNRPRYELDETGFKTSSFKHTTAGGTRNDFKISTNRPQDNTTLGIQIDPHSFFKTDGEEFDDYTTSKIHNFHDRNSYISSSVAPIVTTITKEKHQIHTHFKDHVPDKRNEMPSESSNAEHKNKIHNNQVPNDILNKAGKPIDEDYASVSDDNEGPAVNPDHTANYNLKKEHLDDGEENNEGSKPSNDSKANNMENLMTFMKVVADTIRRNTRRSVNSKTKYLNNLKETILRNIKERIDSTWPEDPPETAGRPHTRVSRAAQATARGHLEIPSSESALMTISFLTFAVFLIKLVLQVIQTYKNKAMMVTPAVVATVGRAATTKRNAKP